MYAPAERQRCGQCGHEGMLWPHSQSQQRRCAAFARSSGGVCKASRDPNMCTDRSERDMNREQRASLPVRVQPSWLTWQKGEAHQSPVMLTCHSSARRSSPAEQHHLSGPLRVPSCVAGACVASASPSVGLAMCCVVSRAAQLLACITSPAATENFN